MAAAPLTIRNLTASPIELRVIERFEAPGKDHGGFKNITRNFATLISNDTSPASPQLAEHAESFVRQEVSIRFEAFATVQTDIKPTEKSPTDILRLTFENAGERYRIDLPLPSETTESTTLVPLTASPRFAYTAIYLPQNSHLTLFSSANLASWMSTFSDSTPLSALSIPGTHNSPTYHRALPSVRCQAVNPTTQLENGVRFFDIRVQPESPPSTSTDLSLVHAVFPISLSGPKYLRGLLDHAFAFLEANPSETLIMSLKREGTGNGTDQQLSRILRDHYSGDVNRWFTAPRIPTLGEARGKIVLIRRFALEDGLRNEWDGAGWGIDAETWEDNTPCATCPSGDVCVQDFYEVLETENIDKKIKFSEDHLERAGGCVCALPGTPALPINAASDEPPRPKQPFYINFLSASNFWKVGCWPEKIAAKLNPAMVEFLCRKHDVEGESKDGDGGTGIVVCDWVGDRGNWDLVRCVVGMNAKLELREKGLL